MVTVLASPEGMLIGLEGVKSASFLFREASGSSSKMAMLGACREDEQLRPAIGNGSSSAFGDTTVESSTLNGRKLRAENNYSFLECK